MTDPEPGGTPSFPALACKSILYRVILRSRSRDPDTGEPLPDLFLRRPGDHRGLSVNIADRCTPAELVSLFLMTIPERRSASQACSQGKPASCARHEAREHHE
jgi:hypothetical protein